MSKIDEMCDYCVSIANDDSHGYSNIHNQGPEYDCGALISAGAQHAGIFPAGVYFEPVGSGRNFNLWNEQALFNARFHKIPYSSLTDLKRGDIVVSGGHVVLYIGNGKFVHAADDYDGKAGDSSGKEITVCPAYDNGNWLYVYRYEDAAEPEYINVNVKLEVIREGCISDQVKNMQGLLNTWLSGLPALELDGYAGPETISHLTIYQRLQQLESDGVCGEITWKDLLS